MRLSDFDYELPPERIAQHPAPRGESRLLELDPRGACHHRVIADLPGLLQPGDLLVANNTRVLPARLLARRAEGGGRIELLLLEKRARREWTALAKPGRRALPGTRLELDGGLAAEIVATTPEGGRRVRFSEPVEPRLEQIGHLPLPPYIRRQDEPRDRIDYQTVFARRLGAVAAPTAGLHFDRRLIEAIRDRGVEIRELTLHVGPGTFRPVRAQRIEQHRMEAERFEIPAATARAVDRTRRRGGRVVAIGTTTVRALETAAARANGPLAATRGTSDLFITPGFRFRLVDLLLTNFHLPRSTLLMLVCAFAGREPLLAAYREAVATGYRFYSYGDAMLLHRPEQGP